MRKKLVIITIALSLLFTGCDALLSFSINYMSNGYTSGSAPVDSNVYTTGASATVEDSGTLVKDGYTFEGWSTQTSGNGSVYQPGDSITFDLADITLYPVWEIDEDDDTGSDTDTDTGSDTDTDTGSDTDTDTGSDTDTDTGSDTESTTVTITAAQAPTTVLITASEE